MEIEGCGLRVMVVLFCESKDTAIKIFIARFVSELQGVSKSLGVVLFSYFKLLPQFFIGFLHSPDNSEHFL